MDERQYQLLMELAEEIRQRPRTPESSMASLQGAGILDENGKFTEPYKHLGMYIENQKKNVQP